ncbi:MAG TPA: hypothetical protein VF874_06255 [Mycobacterium sp.]
MLSKQNEAAKTETLRRHHPALGQPTTVTAAADPLSETLSHICHGGGSLAMPNVPK